MISVMTTRATPAEDDAGDDSNALHRVIESVESLRVQFTRISRKNCAARRLRGRSEAVFRCDLPDFRNASRLVARPAMPGSMSGLLRVGDARHQVGVVRAVLGASPARWPRRTPSCRCRLRSRFRHRPRASSSMYSASLFVPELALFHAALRLRELRAIRVLVGRRQLVPGFPCENTRISGIIRCPVFE